MAFIVRGLLMLSLDINEVSRVPGNDECSSWKMKFDSLCGFHMNTRSTQKYCAPGLELRFAHFGCSGSAGGFTGFGPTWQKPHDMPTRYGRTRCWSL